MKQQEMDQLKELEERIAAYEEVIIRSAKTIGKLQREKLYRKMLLKKRAQMQLKDKEGRKDLLRWVMRVVFKRKTKVKSLTDFDTLESVKHDLVQRAKELKYSASGSLPAYFCKKKTKRIFIFAGVPLYDVGGGQRFAQLARTFDSMGFDVYYIYAFPGEEVKQFQMDIRVTEHVSLEEITTEWFLERCREDSLVIFEIPYDGFESYLDEAGKMGCTTIYEHVDNWDTSLGIMFYQEDVLKRYLDKAGEIVVTARNLKEKIAEHTDREVHYLPNAVNSDIFDSERSYRKPKDLVTGKKTLLYFGSLWGKWFDWEKINYLAEKHPDYQINLIGEYKESLRDLTGNRKNIHFLGEKLQTELPAYLVYSDIALLPFKTCEIGKYVSPLKVFEYIAMDVPVLATKLVDIEGYPNVFCSDDNEEWAAFADNLPTKADNRAFLKENNWFSRCRELLALDNRKEKNLEKISVVVLNYNNMEVIRKCVDSLLMYNGRYSYEIIVVDNGSTDGSFEMLKKEYDGRIRLLRNDRNGCSSGRNLGVKNATGDILCFLDSDQWVIHDYWLDSALELLETEEKIGAVGWGAGWFGLQKIAGMTVDELECRGIKYASVWYRKDIAYLGTDGMLMKKALFEEIGGFDEFYDPTCFEDTDLSLKIRNAGYELAFCPYIGIKHKPHQTTNAGSEKHKALMERNGTYFEEKWQKINSRLLDFY